MEKAESRSSERGKDALGSENGKNRNDATTLLHLREPPLYDFKDRPSCGVFEGGA